MKLLNIKNGFYTDGENLYSCIGRPCIWTASREESEHFLKAGNETAYINAEDREKEVKPVKAGMTFHGGEIKVIDKNTIEVLKINALNPIYDSKGYCTSHDGYFESRVCVNFQGREV